MSAHARLKNGFTEDEKFHNLMSWLINLLVILVSLSMLLWSIMIVIVRFLFVVEISVCFVLLYIARWPSAGKDSLLNCPLVSCYTWCYPFSFGIWVGCIDPWSLLFHLSQLIRKCVLCHMHPRSLNSAFVVRCLDSIIPTLAISKVSSL